MVSTNGEVKKKKTIWKNNRRGERIVPNIANDKWNTGEDEGQHGDSVVQKRQQ